MKEKVLLLNPPASRLYLRDNYCSFTSKADYYWAPADLLILSGLLKNHFEVEILDATILGIGLDQILRSREQSPPHHLVFLTGTASWKEDFAAVEKLQRAWKPRRIVAIGGNLRSQYRTFLDRFPFLDAVLTHYAHNSLPAYLAGEENAANLVNIRTRAHPDLAEISPKIISYPVPLHHQFPLAAYKNPMAARQPYTLVVTQFGCPFRCDYCIGGTLPYAPRDHDNLAEELEYLRHRRVREIWINDWTFNVGTKHPLGVCDTLSKVKYPWSWFCQVRVDNINPELVAAMRAAGCHSVQIGVESADQDLLDRYHKKIHLDQVEDAFALFHRNGIKTLGYFMIGLPGDTEESIRKTAAFARKLDCDLASFAITTPDIGTPLRAECEAKGWVPRDLDSFDSTFSAVIDNGSLDPRKIVELRNQAVREFYFRPAYFWKKWRGIHSYRDFRELVSNFFGLVKNLWE